MGIEGDEINGLRRFAACDRTTSIEGGRKEHLMLDTRPCNVASAEQLDSEIKEIFSLDMDHRSGEIKGTLHVHYTDDSVKQAMLIRSLECRGVRIKWHKKEKGR
jgi:hypothetical protein